jgi:Uncharacterized conserved protein
MAYWLFKSEPDVWGWDQQTAKGAVGEEWGGVRNYQARNNMRAMKTGDLGFFTIPAPVWRLLASSRSAPKATLTAPRMIRVGIVSMSGQCGLSSDPSALRRSRLIYD